jgi:hypothetical protein
MADAKTIRTSNNKISSTQADQSLMSANERNALSAASRHASRVGKDQDAWKNFQSRTGNSADSKRRLAAAANFFKGVNSPTSSIPSLGNSKDSSSYSGVGGANSNSQSKTGSEAKETVQKYGAVERTDLNDGNNTSGSAGGNAGFGGGAGNAASWNLGGDDSGAGVSAGANGGAGGQDQNDKDLKDAAAVTGMAEGDVQKMLNQAEIDRKKLEGGQEDGLFEKVSKAYLRNLDRVLLRKNSSPAQQAAPSGAADKDKEEIKKIFNQ